MPSNAAVFIHFGPYDSAAVVQHKHHRLEGLQNVLQEAGHKVEFVKIPYRNALEVMVNGEIVFQCDQDKLDFGGDGKLDPLCAKALQKVNEAF
ncbi:hypothetical protein LSH36_207g05039 [Paralvinella palmiformis]|uniref:Uncharacterized protein n=1 Tax=Paralvinella palmiformis TaxID=53620 RepID=A0AAD9N781_9ANNE|nr:hypothetical protein LSH36_207g05039 [Paralvinella palmiformis]